MSVTRANELIAKLRDDETLRTAVSKAESRDEKREILASAGFGDVSLEDVSAAAQSYNDELSDAELEAVAGGQYASWAIAISTSVLAAVSAL